MDTSHNLHSWSVTPQTTCIDER